MSCRLCFADTFEISQDVSNLEAAPRVLKSISETKQIAYSGRRDLRCFFTFWRFPAARKCYVAFVSLILLRSRSYVSNLEAAPKMLKSISETKQIAYSGRRDLHCFFTIWRFPAARKCYVAFVSLILLRARCDVSNLEAAPRVLKSISGTKRNSTSGRRDLHCLFTIWRYPAVRKCHLAFVSLILLRYHSDASN